MSLQHLFWKEITGKKRKKKRTSRRGKRKKEGWTWGLLI